MRRDVAEVMELEKKFLRTFDIDKVHADILEAILFEHIEQSNWLGDGVRTIKTSRYDDLKNGVDLIVEFAETMDQFLHMGLAVDVTFGETKLKVKIQEVKNAILKGSLTKIKYFESERSPYKGLYGELPMVVIGVDRPHLVDLARIWIDDDQKGKFAAHPVQKLILHQISQQLMTFSRFAEEHGRSKIAAMYRRQLAVIQRHLAQKKDINAVAYEESDGVGRGIRNQLELF